MIDIDLFFNELNASLESDDDFNKCICRVIKIAEMDTPSGWEIFKSLNYSAFESEMEQAYLKIVKKGGSYKGLYFGLYNPSRLFSYTADGYFVGTRECDLNDKDLKWVHSCYSPEDNGVYLNSKILNKIYKYAYKRNGLENEAEYPLCLSVAMLGARRLGKKHKTKVPIAAGFDSGDILLCYSP